MNCEYGRDDMQLYEKPENGYQRIIKMKWQYHYNALYCTGHFDVKSIEANRIWSIMICTVRCEIWFIARFQNQFTLIFDCDKGSYWRNKSLDQM